jgi:hypothetical protein
VEEPVWGWSTERLADGSPVKAYSARRWGMELLFAKLMNKADDHNGGDGVHPTRKFFVHSSFKLFFTFLRRSFSEPFGFKMVHRVNPIFFKYLLPVPSIGCTSRVKYPARWALREFRRDGRLQGHQGPPQEAAFISPQTCPLQSVQEMRTTTASTA